MRLGAAIGQAHAHAITASTLALVRLMAFLQENEPG
jgi:hypothetical protein